MTARIVTVCVPSYNESSTAFIGNVTEDCPAGIVTVAGTVNSELSLLVKDTEKLALVSELSRSSLPVIAFEPAVSVTDDLLTENSSVSRSRTLTLSLPEKYPAVPGMVRIPATLVPSRKLSSIASIGINTSDWFAGITTDRGIPISSVSSVFARFIVRAARPTVSRFKLQLFKVPKSLRLSSVISRVQTPAGFSPFKSSKDPSGRKRPV